MGCFTVLKSKKNKKSEQTVSIKRINPQQCAPAMLPEPQTDTRALQSATPGFKTAVKAVQVVNRITNNKIQGLSAPSNLNIEGQDAILTIGSEENEDPKSRVGLKKEQPALGPQPLPLPLPQTTSVIKNMGSFKAGNAGGPNLASGPLPLPPSGGLRNFLFEEIAAACLNFSPERCISEGLSSIIYKASFGDDASGSKKLEATVTCLIPSTQGLKKFINEVNTLVSLQHPNLCKLLGFHACEGSEKRMLVYERLFYGSFDNMLYGTPDRPPIDWCTRMKVALCAAQGLAFLHEGPFQVVYNEFSTANIEIDKDFSIKISGYGCICHNQEPDISNNSMAFTNVLVETLERRLLTPRSNVWSFGVVLLELLTGRKNLDSRHPKEERNLVNWSRPFLADDFQLPLIMDPQLKGCFPAKAAQTVANIALRCLQKDPSERPTMRSIVEFLKNVQVMKQFCHSPFQAPSTFTGKQMLRTPSLNGIVTPAPRLSFSPSPPSRSGQTISRARLPTPYITLSPSPCSSTVSLEDTEHLERRKSASSVMGRAEVERF